MNRLRLLRYERGLSQVEVAEGAGISRQTIGVLESGEQPSAPTAKSLADFYGVSVAEILGLTEVDAA